MIIALIQATEFPHREAHGHPLLTAIIRDADIAQALTPAWIQQTVIGLAKEWGMTPMEMLLQEEPFIRGMRFATDWARSAFPQEEIDAKAKEAADLVALLS